MAAEKVVVTKSKLDNLAEIISSKSEEPIPLTIDEMSAAVLDLNLVNNQNNKIIKPTAEQQIITADTGYSGLGQVTVKGMSIEGLEVTPTISDQTFNSSSIDGYLPVTVKGMSIEGLEVTPTISDQTFYSSSIDGYLPVTVKAANLIAKTVDPSSETQVLLPSDEGILARQTSDAVLRGGVNSQGVNVYGNNNFDLSKLVAGKYYKITGTITETITDGLTATETHSINDVYQLTITKYFNIAVSDGLSKYSNIRILSGQFRAIKKEKGDASLTFSNFIISEEHPPIGYSQITVNGDADLLPENIKKDIDIFGVVGTYEGTVINNQDKTVTPTKSQQSIAADNGYTGLGTVTVNPIPSEYIIPTGELEITTNGTSDVTNYVSVDVNVQPTLQSKTITPTESQQTVSPDSGYDALSSVTVNAISSTYVGSGITRRSSSDLDAPLNTVTVPAGYYAEDASKTISNGSVTVTTAKGNVVSNSVKVFGRVNYTQGFISSGSQNDSTGIIIHASDLVSGDKAITQNGTDIDVTNYATVSVNVQPTLQSKTATPTESSQTITPDTGYDGMDEVTVNAISSSYVGSGIDRRSSSDLTGDYGASAAGKYTVTAPSGYYESDATYSLTSKGAPNITTSTSGGKLTVTWEQGFYGGGGKTIATVKDSDDLVVSGATVTVPAGYYATAASASVVSGSASTPATSITANPTISVSSSGLITASVSASQNVTPTVSAGYVSSGTAGTVSVSGSKTQQLTTKAAATITPGTTNQTIAAGTYLTGTQTIAGDADLVASNIKAGVQIFGVTGNLSFITYYTGSSTPSSSLGSDGDIYLKVA